MSMLLLGLVLFIGTHSISMLAPAWRERAVARVGELIWQAVYSILALVGLLLIINGYAEARPGASLLYQPPTALRHLALLLLVPVFPLILATYLPGRLSRLARHPMLLAVKLWALAHLLANGSSVDVLLFGSLLAWAVADRISLKRRPALAVPGAPASAWNDALAVMIGLGIYLALVMGLHTWLIGVSPLGR